MPTFAHYEWNGEKAVQVSPVGIWRVCLLLKKVFLYAVCSGYRSLVSVPSYTHCTSVFKYAIWMLGLKHIIMLNVRSPTLFHFPVLHLLSCTLSVTVCRTHTHTLAWKLHFPASRDYGAMTVTCWDGGDTLSWTKEINFPVTWPSCKAALKRREGLLSPSRFFVGQIMAQQKKQLHYLCISVNPPSLMCTRGNDVKIGSRRWKSGK